MEENTMAFNKNELILDRVRSLTTHDLETKELLFRLTSLEDPTLSCTAEGEEIVDAIGALITTLYRAKKATFGASNSLISLDLAAAQYGTKKEVGAENATITDYAYEILKVDGVSVKLSNKPNVDSVKYIYTIENNEIGTAYERAAEADETHFVVSDEGVITLPTAVTSGKVYVEYTFENANAVRVVNKASNFPTACSMVIYAYFKDVCNENKVYSGKIICPKAKLNPEQVELALTSTGKHAFEFTMMRDYCAEEGMDELFSIVISQ
jgi:hypothetical protein